MAVGVDDKRLRQVATALDTLQQARLVYYPKAAAPTRKREGFQLLNETVSTPSDQEPLRYKIPKSNEDCLAVPMTFFTNGWVHALEDSEIAVLFMIMLGRSSIEHSSGLVAIPARKRLGHYGIPHDSFSDARRFLKSFGLVDVFEVDRHPDGRAEDYGTKGASLHRMKYLPAGLEEDASVVLREQFAHLLPE